MSWSYYLGPLPADKIKEVTEAKVAAASQEIDLSQETLDQIKVAVEAAIILVPHVGNGAPSGNIYLSITGHSNPDHLPRWGWSNDSISITISNASPREEDIY